MWTHSTVPSALVKTFLSWLGLGQPGLKPQVAGGLCFALSLYICVYITYSLKPCLYRHLDSEVSLTWSPSVQSSRSCREDGQ